MSPLALAKQHPIATGATAVVALGALYLLLSSSSASGTGASGTQIDPALLNAELQASLQQQQMQTQIQGATITAQSNLDLLTQKGANDTALAEIQAHTAENIAQIQSNDITTQSYYQYHLGVDTAALQAQVATTQINTQGAVSMAQIQSNVTTNEQNNVAAVQISANNAAVEQAIAALTAGTQQTISNNQSQVAIEQTRGAVQIAKQASGGGGGGTLGSIAEIAGVAAAFLL